MYEQPDWFSGFDRLKQAPDAGLGPAGEQMGLIVVGDKNRWREGDPRQMLVESLKWAVDLERTSHRPNLPHHVCGLAACEAWAKSLEVDADYSARDAGILQTRAMVHCDQVAMLHERREGAKFLRRMAEVAPEAKNDLTAAAALYDEVASYTGKVSKSWNWMEPAAQQVLADPKIRREYASPVREAAAREEQAVRRLEAALAILTATK